MWISQEGNHYKIQRVNKALERDCGDAHLHASLSVGLRTWHEKSVRLRRMCMTGAKEQV
jgi:hypothetical protein